MAKIIVDAFGGDNAPLSAIEGSVMAIKEYGVEIILTGDEQKIRDCALEHGFALEGITIVHAPDVISMCDDPGEIIKSKKECSMAVGLKLLQEGKGEAFVSAGSTGALVMGATFLVKRIKGVKRAALAVGVPTPQGQYLLVDSGANVECRPEMLLSFGVMGSAYLEKAMGVKNPKVGLLNVGTEDTKGGELQLEAYRLLQAAPVNFIGNVEARDVPGGVCDVLVTDGFSGNIVLKLTEGVASTFMGMLKGVFLSSLGGKLAALLVKKPMYGIKKRLDYSESGGAPLMGVTKPVIKAHGSSNAVAMKNAVRQAAAFAASGAIEAVAKALGEGAQQ